MKNRNGKSWRINRLNAMISFFQHHHRRHFVLCLQIQKKSRRFSFVCKVFEVLFFLLYLCQVFNLKFKVEVEKKKKTNSKQYSFQRQTWKRKFKTFVYYYCFFARRTRAKLLMINLIPPMTVISVYFSHSLFIHQGWIFRSRQYLLTYMLN